MYTPMFVPPVDNPRMRGLANVLLPTLANALYRIRDVRLSDECRGRLEELGRSRAIVSPNHPSWHDTVVLLWISRTLRQPFNYLAAREIMDGWTGRVLNHLGAYSVIRGTADRESLRTTRRLLAEMDRKVVIFPEGEIYEYNDTLLAFQSGVAQIGFWAMEDMAKLKKQPTLPIVPVAVKYRCCDSARLAIESSLRGLEVALDLPAAPKSPCYARLRRVGTVMMAAVEKDLGIKPDDTLELRDRIQCYRQRLLERVARGVGAKVDFAQAPADQLHALFNDLKEWVGELPEGANDYEEVLYRRRLEMARPLFHDLQRLQNFIAVTGDYVASEPSAERFLDVLGRLEKEAFGQVRHRVPREAVVRVGAPIRLEERYDQYRESKRQVVADVTRQMEESIRSMLRDLSRESTPLDLDS